jgi:outer membrane protein
MKKHLTPVTMTFILLLGMVVVLCLSSCLSAPRERIQTDNTASGLDSETLLKPENDPVSKETPVSPDTPSGPLRISLMDAVLMAMENNPSLMVERFNPDIQETFVREEKAVFDPVLEAEISAQRNDRSSSDIDDSTTDVYRGSLSLKDFFPLGTFMEVEIAGTLTDDSQYSDPYASTRMGLSLTQPLLRGYGRDVNLAKIRQSRLNTAITRYELAAFSEALLARVETAYWDYSLSQRRIQIFEESLTIAEQQLTETRERIRVGVMAEAELAAVLAEVASQKQGLINARSAQDANRIRLLQLLNPPGKPSWDRTVELVHDPELPEVTLNRESTHVTTAIQNRPEIQQARLDIQRGELELVRTKNGMLPQMDLFVNLGKTGYADSFPGSVRDLPEDSYDVLVGLGFEYPLNNRRARAQRLRSRLQKEQAEKALENLAHLIAFDVRNAYIEVNRSREQITASAATRKFQEENLRIEMEKFRVGNSTNFFVAQAQRDLLLNRINEVSAVVNYLKALTEFYRLEGTLLERRGIHLPGSEPVK